MAGKEPKDGEKGNEPAPVNNPFAALKGAFGNLPSAPEPPPGKPGTKAKAAKKVARAVVRMERKGRGGKEVTVVEQLGLSPDELDAWLLDLKRSLGCGGVVEGENLVLQGDHVERVAARLGELGVVRVVRGR